MGQSSWDGFRTRKVWRGWLGAAALLIASAPFAKAVADPGEMDGPVEVDLMAVGSSSLPGGAVLDRGRIHEHHLPPRVGRMRQVGDDTSDAEAQTGVPSRSPSAAAVPPPVTTSLAISSGSPLITVAGQENTGWYPPDTNGAISSDFILSTVNNQMQVRDRWGKVLVTADLNDFWRSLPTTTNSFDTRSRFDPYSKRFIIMSAGSLSDAPNSGVLLAVSRTADPTGAWYLYRVKADPNSVGWVDYPTLGFNKKWIVVSGNVFGADSHVWVFDKAGLYAGRQGVTVLPGLGWTVQPSETFDASLDDLYLITDQWPNAVLYRLTGAVGAERTELVASVAPALTWYYPPAAPQAGSTQQIPTGFGWFMDCVYRNGSIWATHEVQPPDGPTRSAVQWWKISTTGQLQDFGRIDDPSGTNYYGMAAISANKNNDALIGYTRFSASSYPTTGYSFRAASDPAGQFRADTLFRYGEGSYCCDRWGDYSHTMVDPVNDLDFWTVQEFSSTNGGWGTWWADVTPPPAQVPTVAVRLKSGVVQSETNSPHPQIQVQNTGTVALPLDRTAIRYWFNCDCILPGDLQGWVDFAGILPSGRSITSSTKVVFERVSGSGQTHALLIRFTGGLTLAPGETLQVETRFNKADWRSMPQSNDYSFAPNSTYTASTKIGVYDGSTRLAGQEPSPPIVIP